MSDLTLTRDLVTTLSDLEMLGVDVVRTNGFRLQIKGGVVLDCSGSADFAGALRVFEEGKPPIVMRRDPRRGSGMAGPTLLIECGVIQLSARGGTGSSDEAQVAQAIRGRAGWSADTVFVAGGGPGGGPLEAKLPKVTIGPTRCGCGGTNGSGECLCGKRTQDIADAEMLRVQKSQDAEDAEYAREMAKYFSPPSR